MRLLSLRLKNFRQHADSYIEFRPGLTGIIGPNGAGKSTILEGIAWAIYGAQAARGTNDTIKFSRAGPRTRVEVELRFALGGHEYRVSRTLSNAEVWLDGGPTPVAATLGGATNYLQNAIGMTREEFFNTYFTGQKELQFLAAMGPSERGRFLSQVLGYERLRRAQDLLRERRKEIRAEIKGLQAALGDLDELVAARLEAQQRMGAAVDELKAAELETEEAASELKALLPKWEKAQAARDRHRELTHAIEAAEAEREAARRDLERAEGALAAVAAAEGELAPLKAELEALPPLQAECERLSDLARKDERRKGLARQLVELERDLSRGRERLEKIQNAPELQRRFTEELERLRAEREAVVRELEEKKSAWLRDRQDAETKLQHHRDLGTELLGQIRNIRKLGPEGACPTCGRPMGKDYERLLERFEDQLQDIKQDGVWWKNRFEQLQEKPEDVAELEVRDKWLGAQVETSAQKLTRCQSAVDELAELTPQLDRQEALRAELAAELEAIPAGYDRERHREAERELARLRGVEKQAARLEESVARRPSWEKELEEAKAREAAAAKRHGEATAEREALGFTEAEFLAVRAEHEAAAERHRRCELRAKEMQGAVRTAEHVLQSAQRAEAQYHERAKEIAAQEADLKHHEELDLAYTELRGELNDQVRPELSEIASLFLAQLTDGRYTAMEIDEAYNIMVLDEGEEKPVISGGEEDVANLVLRLSLSQMIAERAGHPLSLLILDEVFGSLDVARRDNVVQLLHHLEDRFEQVVLITHIEGIREGLDQVLRVDYDERTGTSIVREETLGGPEFFPERPMAA